MVQTRSDKNPKSTNNQVVKKPDSDPESDDDGLEFIPGDICGYSSSDDSSDSSSIKKPVVKSRRRKNNIVVGRKPPVRRSTRFSNVKLIDEFANNGLLNKPTKRKKSPVRRQSKRLRVIKSRSDSDNSDIDLETTDDDTDTDEYEDEDEDDENDSDYEEGVDGDDAQENQYTSFVDSIVSELVDETHSAVQKKKAELRAAEWKKNLSKKEIAKLEGQYESICEVIGKMPTIKELLETEMPFKTKCSIMEKLVILENVQDQTFDHLHLKTSINEELRKYKASKINANTYTQYTAIENKINSVDFVDMPLKYRILSSDMSFHNKVAIYNKFKHLENISECSSEHPKLTNWMDTAMSLPYTIKDLPISIKDGNEKINAFLYNVKLKLDEKIYGLDGVKEQILFVLNNMITNPESRGLGMALVGPQGVGKTEIANVLAEAISLPFVSIPLGGSNDSSFLSGHSYTYEGSVPGAIVSSVIKMKQLNGIIFFDELDKISNTRYGSEVSKLLLHITDSTQNHDFKDKYLGNDISINLSNIWFIYSLNYIDALDRTLRDRIPIVMVDGYTKTEKKEITKRHLLPREVKNVGLNPGDIMFSDDALKYLIDKSDEMYTHETKSKGGKSGVRQLKHIISNIVMKLNMIKNCILEDGTFGNLKLSYTIKYFKLPFVVERVHIDKLDVLPKESSSSHLSMYV